VGTRCRRPAVGFPSSQRRAVFFCLDQGPSSPRCSGCHAVASRGFPVFAGVAWDRDPANCMPPGRRMLPTFRGGPPHLIGPRCGCPASGSSHVLPRADWFRKAAARGPALHPTLAAHDGRGGAGGCADLVCHDLGPRLRLLAMFPVLGHRATGFAPPACSSFHQLLRG